jgi:hypothetical protein
MEVTPLPMMMDERAEHPEKAKLPMEVTLAGMVTAARDRRLRKAEPPMEVTGWPARLSGIGKKLPVKEASMPVILNPPFTCAYVRSPCA